MFGILTKLMELEIIFFLGTWITVFSQISAPTRRYFGGASANSLSLLFVNHFVAGSSRRSGLFGQVVVCLETRKSEFDSMIIRQDFMNNMKLLRNGTVTIHSTFFPTR